MLSKRASVIALQLLITIVILAFIFSCVDTNKIDVLIHHAVTSYLFLAFLVLACQVFVASYRWLGLLRIAGFSPPVWLCVGSFAMSSLINTTLPGGVGGDVMRMWVTARNRVPAGVAVYSVIMDRIINLTILGLLVLIILLANLFWIGDRFYTINWVALAFSIALLGAFVGLALVYPITSHFKIHLPLLLTPIGSLSRMIGTVYRQPQQMVVLIGIILLGYLLQITAVILLANGMQASLSTHDAFTGIPIVLLLSAIPITPGGWGIRESAMVLVLEQFNVGMEVALGISILFGIGSTLASLPGITWWFIRKTWVSKPIISEGSF